MFSDRRRFKGRRKIAAVVSAVGDGPSEGGAMTTQFETISPGEERYAESISIVPPRDVIRIPGGGGGEEPRGSPCSDWAA